MMRYRLLRSLHESTRPGRQRVSWWDLSELGLVALGFLLYFLVRGAVDDRAQEALAHARWIVNLELALGIYIEPAINAWVLEHEVLWRLSNFVYFWLDFPLIVGVGLLFFWWRRRYYTLLRDSLLASGGLALVMYWAYPVAPPRFLKEWGFVDTLEVYNELSYQAQSLQPFVNPYAAVPSLHVGWSMLLVYAVFAATRNRLARAGVLLAFAAQSFAVVGTANHFIFDAVAGIAVCLLGLGIALWMQSTFYPSLHGWIDAWLRRQERARQAV